MWLLQLNWCLPTHRPSLDPRSLDPWTSMISKAEITDYKICPWGKGHYPRGRRWQCQENTYVHTWTVARCIMPNVTIRKRMWRSGASLGSAVQHLDFGSCISLWEDPWVNPKPCAFCPWSACHFPSVAILRLRPAVCFLRSHQSILHVLNTAFGMGIRVAPI